MKRYKYTIDGVKDLAVSLCIHLPIMEICLYLIDLIVFGILQLIFGWSRGFTDFMIALPMIILAIYMVGSSIHMLYLSKKLDDTWDELDRKYGNKH